MNEQYSVTVKIFLDGNQWVHWSETILRPAWQASGIRRMRQWMDHYHRNWVEFADEE